MDYYRPYPHQQQQQRRTRKRSSRPAAIGLPLLDERHQHNHPYREQWDDHLPPKVRAAVWCGFALLLVAIALGAVSLGIGIHNWRVNSDHARKIGARFPPGTADYGASEANELVWLRNDGEKRSGHTPRWDAERNQWVPEHGKLSDMEDVRLGSKERPLNEGDILRWERGRVVNARNPLLSQELGQHIDTKFTRPRTGDVPIYNGTAGQWRNVPLATMLTLSSLKDVSLPSHGNHKHSTQRTREAASLADGARLEYDATRGHWSHRPPHARAWLSFCVPIPPNGVTDDPVGSWGHLEIPLSRGTWVPIRPVSDNLSLFAIDQYSNGGMRISRAFSNIVTPRSPIDALGGGRPSGGGVPYKIHATITTRGFPPGAWGFLVGSESTPQTDGFMVRGSVGELVTTTIETIRKVGYEQTISLAYISRRPEEGALQRSPADQNETPLVQCMRVGVEEV